jgi:DNA-binding MarR family transcriptional regulator
MSDTASRATILVRLAKVVELVLDDLGITVNQYRALTLVASGAPPMREFAVRLAMQQPNLSTLIDGLVDRGLVSRRRDGPDRRRVVLSLTKRGHALLERAEKRTSDAIAHVASFDNRRRKALLAGIDRWQDALDGVALELQGTMQSEVARTRDAG